MTDVALGWERMGGEERRVDRRSTPAPGTLIARENPRQHALESAREGTWASPTAPKRPCLQGLEIARARGDRAMEGTLLTNYAEGLLAVRRWTTAENALERALTIARRVDDPLLVAEMVRERAELRVADHDRPSAPTDLIEALAGFERLAATHHAERTRARLATLTTGAEETPP